MAKQKKLNSRSKAASSLKGPESAPPPDMEGMPQGMGEMPPPDMGGGGMPPPDMGGGLPPELAGLMAGGPEGAGAPPPEPTVEDSLMAVEAALSSLPPEAAEEARIHLNAVREIVANAGGGQEPAPEEAMPAPGGAPMPDQELPPV